MTSPHPPAARSEIPVYAIFQGGGATGMAHVGAIKAMEENAIKPIGVAGASAGAIIATLLAVDYRADDLLNDGKDKWNIFESHGTTPVAVLGVWNWRIFSLLRDWWIAAPLAVILMISPLLAFLAVAFVVALLLRTLGIGGPLGTFLRLGFFSTDHARIFLNERLLEKVQERAREKQKPVPASDHLVTFADIDPLNGFLPLKIVVTNIDSGSLELFDSKTPNVSVADAVVASMSIPLFFRPASIRGHGKPDDRYVDGGLLSNLPVWVFLEDKLTAERRRGNSPPLRILAFILNRSAPAERSWIKAALERAFQLVPYLARVVMTGIFGSQTTVARTIPNLEPIEMQSSLGLLAFDCGQKVAIAARDEGARQAADAFEQRFRLWPSKANAALLQIAQDLKAQLGAAGAQPDMLATLRIALLRPSAGQDLRIVASFNRERDADDSMSYDVGSPAASQAFLVKEVHHYALAGATADDLVMTKYEFARQRASLLSVIAVPIFDSLAPWEQENATARPTPLGLLVIDGDFDLEFAYRNDDIVAYLVQVSVGLAGLLLPASAKE